MTETITIIPESIRLIKMTDAEYFSEKYRDYVSNSRLNLINPDQNGSPEIYTNGMKSKFSDSFELGTAIHAMVLQPEYFTISPVIKPNAKLGFFADIVYALEKTGLTRKKAIEEGSISADYYANKLSSKRLETALTACEPYWEERKIFEKEFYTDDIISKGIEPLFLSDAIKSKFIPCLNGVEKSRINSILFPDFAESYNEYAILAEVEVKTEHHTKIMKVKAKLDNFTINHMTKEIVLNDLKTTGTFVNRFMGNYAIIEGEKIWFDGSFQKFRYYRQIAMYLWLLKCALYYIKDIDYVLKANMLVIETIPEFKNRICAVNKIQIKKGIDEFKKLLLLASYI